MKSFFLFFLSCICFSAFGQTKEDIDNLKTFAKVYGYVKYFYPGDEAASIDWNKFAIYGVEILHNPTYPVTLKDKLNIIFKPIAPALLIFETKDKLKFDLKSISPPDTSNYLTTYWQHEGVSTGMVSQTREIYSSIRVNRKFMPHASENYVENNGSMVLSLAGDKLRGKKIKFTAAMKMVSGTGRGFLKAEVLTGNHTLGFSSETPVIDTSWKIYEIIGTIDSTAETLWLSGELRGEGEMLIDDCKLSVFENNSWRLIDLDNPGFESSEIDKSNWHLLNKKYRQKIVDYDQYSGKKCISISSFRNDDYLVSTSHYSGKNLKKYKYNSGEPIFHSGHKIGDVIEKEIENNLTCIMPLALYCNESGTFPKANFYHQRNTSEQIKTDSVNLQLMLADIIITWNVFQHFYPYFDVVKVDWEKELENALNEAYLCKDKNDFQKLLQRFTAKLQDGHIRVNFESSELYYPPFAWELVEDKLVITNVCDQNISLKRGNIVTSINGIDVKDYFSELATRTSAATKGAMTYKLNRLSIAGKKNSKISLVVNDKTIELVRSVPKNKWTCYVPPDKTVAFKILDSDIVYLNLDVIKMKTIDSLMSVLKNCNGLICDLRGYPNDNEDLISHLLPIDDTSSHWMLVPNIINPEQDKIAGYSNFGWNLKSKKPHINCKVIFLTDGRAISYAESYLGFIENYKLATIIGQPSAGTNGNVNRFILPGDYEISWTGMKVVKHDGSRFHGIGILPNIYVEKSIKGISEGRDEYLEKAIEILRQ